MTSTFRKVIEPSSEGPDRATGEEASSSTMAANSMVAPSESSTKRNNNNEGEHTLEREDKQGTLVCLC